MPQQRQAEWTHLTFKFKFTERLKNIRIGFNYDQGTLYDYCALDAINDSLLGILPLDIKKQADAFYLLQLLPTPLTYEPTTVKVKHHSITNNNVTVETRLLKTENHAVIESRLKVYNRNLLSKLKYLFKVRYIKLSSHILKSLRGRIYGNIFYVRFYKWFIN
jgi:hypothetical protein